MSSSLQVDEGITDSRFLEHVSRRDEYDYISLWDYYENLDDCRRERFELFVDTYMTKAEIETGSIEWEQYSMLRKACIEIALKYYFL